MRTYSTKKSSIITLYYFIKERARAIKKILAHELERAMKKKKISQTEMASRLHTSRTAIKRLLDPKNYSITLTTLNKVAHALGKRLDVRLIDNKK